MTPLARSCPPPRSCHRPALALQACATDHFYRAVYRPQLWFTLFGRTAYRSHRSASTTKVLQTIPHPFAQCGRMLA